MPDAVRGVSIYRIRDSVARNAATDTKIVLSPEEPPTIHRGTNRASGHRLTLAVAASRTTAPAWRDVLQPAFTRTIAADTAVSTGALLLIQPPDAATPMFAMAFGSGRRLLDDGVTEPDFGLRVCDLRAERRHRHRPEWRAARAGTAVL
jgi:uncharacterized protein (TIGR04141 family)